MKYLPWFSILLVAASGAVIGCGDDDEDTTDGGGAGSPSAGASSGGTSSGGTRSNGGEPSTAGTAGSSVGSGGEGGAAGAPATAEKDIIDTAIAAGSFTRLAAALTEADLVETLKGVGPFTVFAPTDEAFEAFEDENPGVLDDLTKEELTAILTYHVVAGAAVESADLKDDQVFVTVNGSPVLVDLTGGVKVSDAEVTAADVGASNGVIHVIDKIILPPTDDIVDTAIAAGSFTSLAGALTAADLVDTLKGDGPFTVFAPTDAAFAKLASVPTGDALKSVLLYHVVSGAVGSGDLVEGEVPTLLEDNSVTVSLEDGVQINDSKVTTANIITKNGVIHIVDTVLVPE
jgi:transforming growth factor-beta-induced protein